MDFGSGQYEKYDAVIATYHDQGPATLLNHRLGQELIYSRIE
jgi:4-hydroxy-L-threonine phosphate dehydrogenase PdxA